MKTMDANRISPGYELKDELARLCLPAANRDPNRKFGWVNSICILFLFIGIFGVKLGVISQVTPPPIEEVIPTIIDPVILPPQSVEDQKQEKTEQEKTDTSQVTFVTPEAPNINFSVPTIGSLVVPAALASPPPLKPMQAPEPVKSRMATLANTGTGGLRPQPPYPKLALEQAAQGTVTLLLIGDAVGNIASIELKDSSGSGILDRATQDFIKRHWTLPAGTTNQVFETSITYQLQTN
jgi:TonB family protein